MEHTEYGESLQQYRGRLRVENRFFTNLGNWNTRGSKCELKVNWEHPRLIMVYQLNSFNEIICANKDNDKFCINWWYNLENKDRKYVLRTNISLRMKIEIKYRTNCKKSNFL